jgi:MoxR-like ATPase
MSNWWIFKGTGEPHNGIRSKLPAPPSWRVFPGSPLDIPFEDSETDAMMKRLLARGATFQPSPEEIELVNAALYLRRPLLITGKPGSGKSSLAYAVARELKLGPVLRWSITTRSTLAEGLYRYDAISRLQDASLRKDNPADKEAPDIGQYIHLGPLGAALLPTPYPRVLLIDEIDKSDIDLPNDLLNIFEEGEFEIPELVRLAKDTRQVAIYYGNKSKLRVPIEDGHIQCCAFPFVVLTSNGEREFPPAFLRRCLRLDMQPPDKEKLLKIVEAHLGQDILIETEQLVEEFISRREKGDVATDQLLNAVYLASRGIDIRDKNILFDALLRYLGTTEG